MRAGKKEEPILTPVPMEDLDSFVVIVIEVLKDTKDPFAIAKVKDILLTPPLKELLLFVGITAKQSNNSVLFAWTESVKSTNAEEFNED